MYAISNKGRRAVTVIVLLWILLLQLFAAGTGSSKGTVTLSVKNRPVTEVLDMTEKQTGVHFVYESDMVAQLPAITIRAEKEPVEKFVSRLCSMTGLTWKTTGNIIILKRSKANYTINGYITDENGETLLGAALWDRKTRRGTVSNEFGFYSLRLPAGTVNLSASYVGFTDMEADFVLDRDTTLSFRLTPSTLLKEVIVKADSINSVLHTTQTGQVSLAASDFTPRPSALGSPDLVKTLQAKAGVASGTELFAGMFVRGGESDQNLFLIDGNPLYQINHLGGLYSAFNTSAVKTVDFYKSGFPARYGGRLSSVVDVRTKDGNMKELHGSFTIGMIDGNIQLEGPIVKNRTSFNIALRRTWFDVITAPAMGIYNAAHPDDRTFFNYAFHDMNAKITHRFSDRNKLSVSVYSGRDKFKSKESSKTDYQDYDDNMQLAWGNTVASLNWNTVLRPNLFGDISLIYSQFSTDISEKVNDFSNKGKNGEWMNIQKDFRQDKTVIRDMGYRMNFDYRPSSRHHIRFGSDYLFHIFSPQKNISEKYLKEDSITKSHKQYSNAKSLHAHELSLYIEDEADITTWWKANAGVRGTLFSVKGKNYFAVEPRLSTRFSLSSDISLKASYTMMSQYVHMLSTTYLSLPSDMWVPVTDKIAPMLSQQAVLGMYFRLPAGMEASLEGYYKTMDNLIDYRDTPRFTAPFDTWEEKVTTGKGRSYGLEATLSRTSGRTTGEISYTLSWTERKFAEHNSGKWYPSKYDNRHKLNIAIAHRISKKVEIMGAWTYATGNRVTVQLQEYSYPSSPWGNTSGVNGYFDHPNNVQLPAYHRLDLGLNIYKPTKRGNMGIWNISIYNAYCRFNPFKVEVQEEMNYIEDNKPVHKPFQVKAKGFIPIIPTFSYTLKF